MYCTFKLIHKRLAALTLGLLAEVEGQSFEKRLPLFLPLLYDCVCLYDPEAPEGVHEETGNTESEDEGDTANCESNKSDHVNGMEGERTENEESEMDIEPSAELPSESAASSTSSHSASAKLLDHLLFSSLTTLRKICSECSVLRGPTHREDMNRMWGKFIQHTNFCLTESKSNVISYTFKALMVHISVQYTCIPPRVDTAYASINLKAGEMSFTLHPSLSRTSPSPDPPSSRVDQTHFLATLWAALCWLHTRRACHHGNRG